VACCRTSMRETGFMGIVRFALKRPYTFVIVAVLIAIFGVASIVTTPTDILPDIAIPIVSVIWTYSGLDADDMSKRIIGVCERALPTTVNNIQSTESQSYSGVGVIKIHFQPNVQIDLAIAQVTALAQSLLRLMPTGILPPYVLKYDASSVPIVQVSLGGQGLSQTELYDLGQNFVRGQLATIKGAAVPLPYGGKQRSIMVDVEPVQLAANHLAASDLSLALSNQNLVTPSGTEKIGDREYLVGTNSSPGTIAELNSLPIRTVNGAVVQMKDFVCETGGLNANSVVESVIEVLRGVAAVNRQHLTFSIVGVGVLCPILSIRCRATQTGVTDSGGTGAGLHGVSVVGRAGRQLGRADNSRSFTTEISMASSSVAM
jgi:multidrug efflux pump subunit AcrB